MPPIRQALVIASIEIGFLRRFRHLLLATVAVIGLPAFYTLLYLSSVWNPTAHTGSLAVGLVNLDQGLSQGERQVNLGQQVVAGLKSNPRFGYQALTDAELARSRVRTGQLAFALVIPPEFSANAVLGAKSGDGRLLVYASAGNNFESARLARAFAEALEGQVNDRLNEERWRMVLQGADGSQDKLLQLREGVRQLQLGAQALSLGADEAAAGAAATSKGALRLHEGVVHLTSAAQQLRPSLRTLQSRVPPAAELQPLDDGLQALQQRVPDDSALDGLADGANKLAASVAALGQGIGQIRDGATELAGGTRLLAQSLPAAGPAMQGSAQGLSHSVRPVVEIDAPVANHGSAFAPNVVLGALWLGAAISAFLIHVRVLPRQAQHFHPLMQLLGKAALPAGLVLLQAALVLGVLHFVLHIQVLHPWVLALVLATASWAFLAMVLAATRLLGDAGKALVMVFLALQLSSSGGILPVELSGSLFETISPWLPMTWAVKAVKASMFGAYESAWQMPWGVLALTGVLAMALATVLGRWRYVDPAEMRPAVQF